MANAIVPVAKTLFLCEEIETEWGMTNLSGLLNSFGPSRYPHTQGGFAAFVQLGQGLGDVTFHIDIRRASDYGLIHATASRLLRFERRTQLLQVVMRFDSTNRECISSKCIAIIPGSEMSHWN